MTPRFRLTVLGAIAALTLVVPVSTERGTPPSRIQAGPSKKLLFLADDNVSQVGRFRIPMGFSRDRVHVSLSLDTQRMDMSDLPQLKKSGDYPQAWEPSYGEGRVFYAALGHRDDIWSNDAVFRAHIKGGIRWALDLE